MVNDLLTKMTIEEKIALLEGKDVWHTADIKRLNIPSLFMADGPHGIRKQKDNSDQTGEQGSFPATCFPSISLVAAGFNKELTFDIGKAVGEEARSMGVDIVLGPGVNIKRNPLCGRNFEYFSEDPIVSAYLASAWIRGVESNNIGACVKHYALNSQETYRFISNSVIDERSLRDIYLKAFEYVVSKKVTAVMTSYNKINGVYASENKHILNDILRDEWQFLGLTISDWGAVNNRSLGLKNGLDLQMPSSNGHSAKILLESFKTGEITIEEIDNAVLRILKTIDKFKNNDIVSFDIEKHHELAKDMAADSIVLLKNENNILPLKKEEKILLVGSFHKYPRYQGGGSSKVNPSKLESIYDNISKYTEFYSYIDGYDQNGIIDEEAILKTIEMAKEVDKVVIAVGMFNETEGIDRENIDLPECQKILIERLAQVNSNIVAVLTSGGVVSLVWDTFVKGLLNCYFPGQAGAIAILDILYGKISPSGRLPETYADNINDYITTKNFADGNSAVWYEESIFVGYRYFNTFKKHVRYPFGFGLSYTDFTYHSLVIDSQSIVKNKKIKVSVKVKNIGSIKSKEVVLLFIENNQSTVYKVLRELKEFTKIELNPGEEKVVAFELDYNSFAYYDINLKHNYVDKGVYKIQICRNVEDVILEGVIERKEDDPCFIQHTITNYNNKDDYLINKDDFITILGYDAPSKVVVAQRPYSLASTLEDIKDTFIGKIVIRQIVKQSKNLPAAQNQPITHFPLRVLSQFSNGVLPLHQAEGIIDIANRRFIKGIKKILKRSQRK